MKVKDIILKEALEEKREASEKALQAFAEENSSAQV